VTRKLIVSFVARPGKNWTFRISIFSDENTKKLDHFSGTKIALYSKMVLIRGAAKWCHTIIRPILTQIADPIKLFSCSIFAANLECLLHIEKFIENKIA